MARACTWSPWLVKRAFHHYKHTALRRRSQNQHFAWLHMSGSSTQDISWAIVKTSRSCVSACIKLHTVYINSPQMTRELSFERCHVPPVISAGHTHPREWQMVCDQDKRGIPEGLQKSDYSKHGSFRTSAITDYTNRACFHHQKKDPHICHNLLHFCVITSTCWCLV